MKEPLVRQNAPREHKLQHLMKGGCGLYISDKYSSEVLSNTHSLEFEANSINHGHFRS